MPNNHQRIYNRKNTKTLLWGESATLIGGKGEERTPLLYLPSPRIQQGEGKGELAQGIYFVRLSADNQTVVQKLIVLR